MRNLIELLEIATLLTSPLLIVGGNMKPLGRAENSQRFLFGGLKSRRRLVFVVARFDGTGRLANSATSLVRKAKSAQPQHQFR
jgi:hypothetical protein